MKKHFLLIFTALLMGFSAFDSFADILPTSIDGNLTVNTKLTPISFKSNKTKEPRAFYFFGIKKTGSLPPGLTLNQLGVLSGVPKVEGNFTFTVQYYKSNKREVHDSSPPITIRVVKASPPTITTTSPLSPGQMDVPYVLDFQRFRAENGVRFLPTPDKPTGYNWSLSWGKIPTGMTFNTVGALSGIPRLDPKLSGNFTQNQTFTFNITATDAVLGNNTKTFTLTIKPPVPPTIVTDCPLPEGLELYPYANVYLKATSGKKEYKWSVGNSTNFPLPEGAFNRFPDGLKLSLAGTISGKPTLPGLFVFRLKVTDANGLTAEKECRITIMPAPEPPKYCFLCLYEGDYRCFPGTTRGGLPPYTWTATGLPPGLSINSSTGEVCGTCSNSGTYETNITVKESSRGGTATSTFTIVVMPKLEITTNSPLPWGIVGRSYPTTASLSPVKIEAIGGWSSSKKWIVLFGKLPDDLKLDPDTGIIYGTPSKKGTYKFTIRVQDECKPSSPSLECDDSPRIKYVDKEFVIDIYDPITLPTPPIPCLTVNKPFSTTLTASGGKGELTWKVTSVSSPAYTVTPTGVKTATLAGTPSDSAPLAIVVLVTDENGYAEEFTLNYSEVNAPLVITTNCPFPAGEVDKPYSAQLTATGGKQPYTWEILPQIYVADFNNNKIRKFYEGGIVKTYAGNGINQSIDGNLNASSFNGPYGMAFDPKGNIYVADRAKIRKISISGFVTTLNGTFIPEDMVADDSGNVYVGDSGNYKVRKIDPLGNVTDVAGSGTQGSLDGNGSLAKFWNIQGICWDLDGNIILTDQNKHLIRKVTIQGNVSTIAGGIGGYQDGNVKVSQFNDPHDVKVHHDGTIYVLDHSNGCIRKISKNGIVSTLGTKNNLTTPYCLSADNQGFVYVSDGRTNHNISKISPSGNVTVIAGGGADFVDNIEPRKAKFDNPRGVEINPYEDLPLGLTLNSTTGVISGTPKKHGLYNITYRVTDACGNSAIKECQLTIAPAPLICSQTLSLPCLSKKPISLQIVADNDYALFAGNETAITRLIYQNNVPWGGQLTNAATNTFSLQAGEDTFYVLAMNAWGPGDISGKINNKNIADLVANNNIKKSSDVSSYLNFYNSSSWAVENGTYNVTLGDAQNARNLASAWDFPSVNFTNTVIMANPYAYSNTLSKRAGFDLPSYQAVFFRFSVADVASLPDTTVLTVSGGVAPYTWLISGNLPTGLEYKTSPNGDALIFYGSFAESGSFPIVVTVTDAAGTVCSGSHTIEVNPELQITNSCPLANGTKGIFYSQSLTATGGKPSYTWALVPANTGLPPGLALNSSTGLISGTPTATGNYTFSYKVTDSCSQNATKNCTIQIGVSNPFDDPNGPITGNVYKMQENSTSLYTRAELENMTPVTSIRSSNFDIPIQSFNVGFAGRSDLTEWFQIKYDGFIEITNAGNYIFKIVSDDGARLRIYDGSNAIIDFPTGQSALFSLLAKVYRFELDYYQGPRYLLGLQLFWSKDGSAQTIIPPENFVANSSSSISPAPSMFAMASPNLSGTLKDCVVNAKTLVPNVSDKDLTKTDHLVAIPFLIGKIEVTNDEYCVFLNAIAKQSDPRGLYNVAMSSALNGGILRTGNAGAYSYTVKPGMGNYPVVYVSWFDAARHVNWLSNGSPTGLQDKTATEDGTYALNGAVSGVSIVRNAINPNTKLKPTRWLLNESEWFTSAYLKSSDSTSVSFWNYPMQSDTSPDLKLTNPKNLANYGNIFDGPTEVGFFSDSPSAFGTFDQGGNVREWTESVDSTKYRIIRGGSWSDSADAMKASESDVADPTLEDDKTGFRIGGEP